MHALGFSLDNLSLLALTLSVGFVVDDAMIMLENIVRHVEMGKPRCTLPSKSRNRLYHRLMTISLIAVFIPVLFMSGIVGRLLNEFAVTICAAIVSGVVSLTLTPMLCSRYLKPTKQEEHGKVFRAFEHFFDTLLSAYKTSLSWAMAAPRLIMIGFVSTFILTAVFFSQVPKTSSPADSGQISNH